MRNRLYSLMLHYAQLFEVTQYPSPTETLARRMQDAVDAATAGDQLHREVEQGHLDHQANMNAQYDHLWRSIIFLPTVELLLQMPVSLLWLLLLKTRQQ